MFVILAFALCRRRSYRWQTARMRALIEDPESDQKESARGEEHPAQWSEPPKASDEFEIFSYSFFSMTIRVSAS